MREIREVKTYNYKTTMKLPNLMCISMSKLSPPEGQSIEVVLLLVGATARS